MTASEQEAYERLAEVLGTFIDRVDRYDWLISTTKQTQAVVPNALKPLREAFADLG